jgi:N-acetylglucosamine-6-sulfatase
MSAAAAEALTIITTMSSGGRLGMGSRLRPWRRAVVVGGALVLAVAAGAVLVWGPGPGGGSNRPNFVVIVTDDQRWDTLGSMPAVRRLLMTGGVTFRNAFVTTPSCCPSRVSLLTGQYSHRSGVLDGSVDNAPGGAPAFEDDSSLATWLDDAGYRTGLVGKYLNDYAAMPVGYVPPGWDEWFAIAQARPQIRYYDFALNENGKIVRYGNEPADYSTSVLRGKAVPFVEGEGPFFLYFAPIAPHPPATPALDDLEAPVTAWDPPPSFGEADLSDKPDRRTGMYDPTTVRSTREQMLRSLLAVDRAIAEIHEAVSDAGLLDETYFLLTSDNGFLWGEHRLMGKVWPFEESIRVPLVIRPPGSNPTRIVERMALNIDVPPTVADLAGVEATPPPDGISLVPLLGGAEVPTRDRFVVEFLGFAPNVPPYVALRTEHFLYVEYRNGWRELYDLRADPFQLRNMLSDDGRAPPQLVTRLSGSLKTLSTG